MTKPINTKLTPEFFKTSRTPPNFKKRNTELIVRSIPVSENKRAACHAIQSGVLGQIEARIAEEKRQREAKAAREELAAKPFKDFKAKLSNPRIKP